MFNALAPTIQNAMLYQSQLGLAPYGLRHGSFTTKGKGYFGPLRSQSGDISTEISAESDGMEYPLLVPTLTRSEIQHLLSGAAPTNDIYDKAESYARMRVSKGLSPFASPTELRIPVNALPVYGY